MSSLTVVPFNFQPANVSVKTGSYTIPAGKYAKVDVQCEAGGSFTIDGLTALTSKSWTVLSSDNLGTYNGNGGEKILATGSTTTFAGNGGAFNEATAYDSQTQSYWLPSGAIINGSGTWRAVVQEFNNIT